MSKAAELAALIGSQTALSNRNLIINGAAVIDQRNGGSSVSVTGGTTKALVDRWKADISGAVNGVFSAQQQTSVVPTGFQYATKLTVTTAHTTAGTGHYYRYFYAGIEGYETNQLEIGNSNAKTVTISFYVRSSVTGTYCVGLQNASFNRAYSAEYSISSANTWERKEVTIALDQTGTWDSTNGIGLKLFWDLGSGSNWDMTADSWAASNTWKTSNQTAWIENASATFYITGVQLEVGETATPFEHRSYGDELRRCQRYYWENGGQDYTAHGAGMNLNSTTSDIALHLPVTMRSSPTVTSNALGIQSGSTTYAVSSFSSIIANTNVLFLRATVSGVTAGYGAMLVNNNNASGYVKYDAEL